MEQEIHQEIKVLQESKNDIRKNIDTTQTEIKGNIYNMNLQFRVWLLMLRSFAKIIPTQYNVS